MDLDKLNLLLKGKYSVSSFREDIFEELKNYLTLKYLAKDSFNFRIKESISVDYSDKDIIVLLDYYLKGELLEWELGYIFNCIDLSEKWEGTAKASEVVFYLAEPEINFPISRDSAKLCTDYLSHKLNRFPNIDKVNILENYRSVLIDVRILR